MISEMKKVCMRSALFLVFAAGVQSQGAIWYVSLDGSQNGDGTSLQTSFDTIQAGIDAATDGDIVEIADGTYTGDGNKNLDFNGKAITVRSASNIPARCVINCQNDGHGFDFHSGESASSILMGLLIENGYSIDNPGGAISCDESDPVIDNCVFRNNKIKGGISRRGGGVSVINSSAKISNCFFYNNYARLGGGLYVSYDSNPTVVNCSFIRNRALTGGGIYNTLHSQGRYTNCTILDNTADLFGGIGIAGGSSVTITNCIAWGNSPSQVEALNSSARVTYSNIQGGMPGSGNINENPLFAFPNDIHLMPGSPCIDTGTNNPAGGLPEYDPEGRPRILDGNADTLSVIDMGTYEYVNESSTIAISPYAIDLLIPVGADSPEAQTLSIRNSGGGTLHWEISNLPAWLTASELSGYSDGEADTITLNVDVTGLKPGYHSASIEIRDQQSILLPREVRVCLYISQEIRVPEDYGTIQAAISAANNGDDVVLANGYYTGTGNKDICFYGKAITVRSEFDNPYECMINCQGHGRGFSFSHDEGLDSIVRGISVVRSSLAAFKCSSSSPTIRNCIITDNQRPTQSTTYGGGAWLYGSNTQFQDCVFARNRARYGSGAYCQNSHITFTNCTFSSNVCRNDWFTLEGGALYCSGSSISMENCIVSNNQAKSIDANQTGFGGGIYCTDESEITLTHCNIIDNEANEGGGIFCHADSAITIGNSILWGSEPDQIANAPNTTTVLYSNVEEGWPGEGNISSSPAFAIPGEYRLLADSPCIDAGNNDLPWNIPFLDILGNPRPLDGDEDGNAIADIGAVEFDPLVPLLFVSPTSFNLNYIDGDSIPDQQITISNRGGSTLNWEITGQPDWITVTPDSGQTTEDDTTITLSFVLNNLDKKQYHAVLGIDAPMALYSPQQVTIDLNFIRTLSVPEEYVTIQDAVNAAVDGETVEIGDGLYSGPGNINIDFKGKAITVQSKSGNFSSCIIDCEGDGRGFYFHQGESTDSVLNGLTIMNGYVDDSSPGGAFGGGILCSHTEPTISNCRLLNNEIGDVATIGGGGGMYNLSSIPRVLNCEFEGNKAVGDYHYGGGMCNVDSDSFIKDCVFRNNSAFQAGAIQNMDESCPYFSQCTITGNTSHQRGGGVVNLQGSDSQIVDCLIKDNTATEYGGGGILNIAANPIVRYCVFEGNKAGIDGLSDVDQGGGIYNSECKPSIRGCLFVDNTAFYGGGIYNELSQPSVKNCIFIANSAYSQEKGIVSAGGGIYNLHSESAVSNSTFWGNIANDGGGIFNKESVSSVANSILWENDPQSLTNVSDEGEEELIPQVTYSCIQHGADEIWFGTGCIDSNPLLINPTGSDEAPVTWNDNNLRLSPNSPCIDAGDNSAYPMDSLFEYDFDGNFRFIDDPRVPDTGHGSVPIIDMGAFELQYPPIGDLDGNGEIDLDDYALFAQCLVGPNVTQAPAGIDPNIFSSADLNEDGDVDLQDFMIFQRLIME